MGLEPTVKCSRGEESALGFYSRSPHRLDCTICTVLPLLLQTLNSLIEVSVRDEIKIAFKVITAAIESMFNIALM
jgi:hypothetical protein